MRSILSLFAAAALLLPVPALAAGPDWAAASAAYQKGKASPSAKLTVADQVVCASYYAAWTDALNDNRLTPVALAALHKDLSPPDARMTALGWLLWIGEDDAVMNYFDQQKATAKWLLGKGIAGEQAPLEGVTSMLGSCYELPEEE